MRKLEIHEIKDLSYEVLCSIRDVCEQNNISYSLTGGTLIGAVRHRGFIPWDDDIDIMMPRPDYDKFISIIKQDAPTGFWLAAEEMCGGEYTYPFAKACHPKTVLIERHMQQTELKLGVYVDIFPVDGIADTYRVAKFRCKLFQIWHGLKLMSNWTCYRRSKLRKWYYEPLRYVCYIASKIVPRQFIDKRLNNFVRKKTFEKSNFAGRMVGDFGSKEIMPQQMFMGKTKLEFEGSVFDAIDDYHTFLTNLYGDYMTLPPPEKRITHHEYDAYYID